MAVLVAAEATCSPWLGRPHPSVLQGVIRLDSGVLRSLGASHCLNKVISFGLLSGDYSINILIQ